MPGTVDVPLLGQLQAMNLAASSKQILGSNPRRKGILLGTNTASAYFITFGSQPAAVNAGILIAAGLAPVWINEAMIGSLIRESVNAISASGTPGIVFVETFAP